MPKSPRAEYILVTRDEIERSLYGFLDMLRYDSASMQDVSHGYVILRTLRQFTMGRWHSFGIHPVGPEITTLDYWAAAAQDLIRQWQAD